MVQQEPKLGLLLLSLVEPSRGNQFTKGMAMGSSILAYVNTALAQEISGLEFSTWAQPHVQCFGRYGRPEMGDPSNNKKNSHYGSKQVS